MTEQIKIADKKITDLVDLLVSKNNEVYKIFETKYDKKSMPASQMGREFVDPTREFKDLATDIVVNNYANHSLEMSKFINLIVSTFSTALDYYAIKKGFSKDQFFFVYKGGNVLRLVGYEFLYELPGTAVGVLEKFYGPRFKKSDADFSIYIDPKISNFDDVFDEITILSYHLLDILRKTILENEDSLFDFSRYSDSYKKKILDSYLVKLNESETIKNPDSTYYQGKFVKLQSRNVSAVIPGYSTTQSSSSSRHDLLIQNSNTAGETDVYQLRNEPESDQYISTNTTLTFEAGGYLISFNLVRTKVNFIMEIYRNGQLLPMNIGGELIDVSIPGKKDARHESFFENINKNIKEYHVTKPFDFKFKSYTIDYFISDLFFILFRQFPHPWDDRKYQKRIDRLFFFYFIDMLGPKINSMQRSALITDLLNKCVRPLKNAQNADQVVQHINDKISETKTFGLKIENFLIEYKNILEKKEIPLNDPDLQKFIENIESNLQTIFEANSELEQFIESKGRIEEQQLYDVDTQMGGYYKKYIKYKAKYLHKRY